MIDVQESTEKASEKKSRKQPSARKTKPALSILNLSLKLAIESISWRHEIDSTRTFEQVQLVELTTEL